MSKVFRLIPCDADTLVLLEELTVRRTALSGTVQMDWIVLARIANKTVQRIRKRLHTSATTEHSTHKRHEAWLEKHHGDKRKPAQYGAGHMERFISA
ncbi:hypothetical protein AGMMS49974_11410 [Deltaproteobacteria bacterium]|nr:hypothetical protein AGMMS49974_11410 [Deltaproteobacteria bacterium]